MIDKNDEVIDAFNMMWGSFPEPVMLIHKSKEILAINEAGFKSGDFVVGTKCSEMGPSEAHKGCLANQTLSTQRACYTKNKMGDKEIIGYWLPVSGHPDIYVHLGVGMLDYDNPPFPTP